MRCFFGEVLESFFRDNSHRRIRINLARYGLESTVRPLLQKEKVFWWTRIDGTFQRNQFLQAFFFGLRLLMDLK